MRGVKGGECGVDNVLSALGVGYSKALHYTIAHLRRADGGLSLTEAEASGGSLAGNTSCTMDLLSGGDKRC